jgi:hypothetical protein
MHIISDFRATSLVIDTVICYHKLDLFTIIIMINPSERLSKILFSCFCGFSNSDFVPLNDWMVMNDTIGKMRGSGRGLF